MRMNLTRCLLLLAATAIAVSCGKPKPATITITSSEPREVTLYKYPGSGEMLLSILPKTLTLEAGVPLTLSYDMNNRTTSMKVTIGDDKAYAVLQAGKNTILTYDPASSPRFSFTGDNAEGQELLNIQRKEKDIYKYMWIDDFTVFPLDTVATTMESNFCEIAKNEIASFEALCKEGKIDRDFLEFAQLDIAYYYSAAMSRIIATKRYQGRESESPLSDGYKELWTRLYTQYPPDRASLRTYDIEMYGQLYASEYIPSLIPGFIKYQSFDEYLTTTSGNYSHIKDKKAREALNASWLCYEGLNNTSFNKTLIDLLKNFDNEYPGNPYSSLFTQYIEPAEVFYRKIELPFDEKMRFFDDNDSMVTLRQVLDKFKGKDLFVDFWFSTCSPCREDFAYNTPLKEFLDANGIEKLYISVDGPGKKELWENTIKYFDLYGYHVNAVKDLHIDIYETYNLHFYPTYMIVNKKGEIVEARAKSPSETTALYDQIKEKLGL